MNAWFLALAIGAATPGVANTNLAGDYAPDFSKAPNGGGAAKGYFQGTLHLAADQTFYMPNIEMQGFWRLHQGRLVLVYRGFFGTTYAEPDAVLKTKWPTSLTEGHVLDILPDGTLRLKEFGRSPGPISFRKVPRRGTRELVALSRGDDSPESTLAWVILRDEGPRRWKELIALVQDPRADLEDRSWAIAFLGETAGMEGNRAALHALEALNTKGLKASQIRQLRRFLAKQVAESGQAPLMARLIEIAPKFDIPQRTLAEGIARAKYLEGIPLLEDMLGSSSAVVRAAASDALATLGAKSSLGEVRKLTADPEPRVRVSANWAIAKLSGDPAEKDAAVKALVGLIDSSEFANASVLKALGESGSKSALPYLVNIVENDKDVYDRAVAAEALGFLGFKEAVPALRKALEVPVPAKEPRTAEEAFEGLKGAVDFAMANDRVRKAAAEALWKLGAWESAPMSK